MDAFGSLHTDAHVRPLSVVEANDTFQNTSAFVPCRYRHLVEPLYLQYPVRPFGDGVFQRISALCHADADSILIQFRDIFVAAVLASSVGVVDEPARDVDVYRGKRHPESLQRIFRLQRRAYRPADYLVGIGISDEGQITYALAGLHISYIAHPYLIGMGWYHILYQVGIFAIVVVGVRRPVVPPSLQTYHETVAAEKFDEGISAWHAACLLEQLLDYQVQFGASQAGIVLPVFLDLLHDKRLYRVVREVRVIPFVV